MGRGIVILDPCSPLSSLDFFLTEHRRGELFNVVNCIAQFESICAVCVFIGVKSVYVNNHGTGLWAHSQSACVSPRHPYKKVFVWV